MKMGFSKTFLILALTSVMVFLASADTFYKSTTQVCCNGTVGEKNGSDTMSCCGNEPYDYQTSLCCMHDQVLERPASNDSSNGHGYGCCNDQETNTATLYNYELQECCDGKAIDKPNQTLYYSCCNGELYHWSTHVCCDGVIQKRDEETACCGDTELYNTTSQLCCETYDFVDNGMTVVVEYTINNVTSDSSTCCGVEMFDLTTQICCKGVVMEKKGDIGLKSWGQCCGNEPFDAQTQICCSKWGEIDSNQYGEIASKLHNTSQMYSSSCCGLEAFDYRNGICCNDDTVIDKPEGSNKYEWMSCCGGQVITNHTTEFCYDEKIYEREDYNIYVCGNTPYDQRKEVCCGNELYASNSTLECCYGAEMMYDPSRQICCIEEVKTLTDDEIEANYDSFCAVLHYGGWTDMAG